jgi:flavin-dependent dehydrogenase
MPAQNADFQADALIVGGGPAGSACAGFLAAGGKRVILLERRRFPREKVCGDCLNPAAWPVLESLGVADAVSALPQTPLAGVELIDSRDRSRAVPWPIGGGPGEIAVKRSLLDAALLDRAVALGAEVRQEALVTGVEPRPAGWQVTLQGGEVLRAPWLIAADGRNSTVARLAGRLPTARRDRVGFQTHCAAPAGFHQRVVLRLRPQGYVGYTRVGGDELNLCLVSAPRGLPALRAWAEAEFGLRADQPWQSIAPLARPDADPARDRLLLIGDAARVVEPFTGEGIYYALRTGQLAAAALLGEAEPHAAYRRAHAELYRGRLWINRFARLAVTNPRLGQVAFDVVYRHPALLRWLAGKVVAV